MSDTEVDVETTTKGSTLKVSVDNTLCQGHARCWHIAPEFFTLDEEGYSNIGQGKVVPAGMRKQVLSGVAACPEKALSIEQDG